MKPAACSADPDQPYEEARGEGEAARRWQQPTMRPHHKVKAWTLSFTLTSLTQVSKFLNFNLRYSNILNVRPCVFYKVYKYYRRMRLKGRKML